MFLFLFNWAEGCMHLLGCMLCICVPFVDIGKLGEGRDGVELHTEVKRRGCKSGHSGNFSMSSLNWLHFLVESSQRG